jgi:Spy/CpxP family protein refolding chaperone
MKGSTLKFVLFISLLLNISMIISAGYTYYQHRQMGYAPCFVYDFQKGNRFIFNKLDLRPEQMSVFREKALPFRTKIIEKKHDILQKRSALLELMRAEKPDKPAIDAAIVDINRMQEDMQRMVISHMLEMKAMLNKDQQKRFFDLIEKTMGATMDMPMPMIH